jgi:hypothetical protein
VASVTADTAAIETARGKGLARKFVHLFHDARKRYLESVADVALAQKTHRLKWLERLAAEAERIGDITGAAEFIEKASKDSTDYWTRSHTVRHGGQVATPAEPRQDHRATAGPHSTHLPAG